MKVIPFTRQNSSSQRGSLGSTPFDGFGPCPIVCHEDDEVTHCEGEGGAGDCSDEGHCSVPDDSNVALAPLPADPPEEPKAGFACPAPWNGETGSPEAVASDSWPVQTELVFRKQLSRLGGTVLHRQNSLRSGCKVTQLHPLRNGQEFARYLLQNLRLGGARQGSVNRCPIRVGVTENVLWSSLGIKVNQASVAQQKFRHWWLASSTSKKTRWAWACH